MEVLLHITSLSAWEEARSIGLYVTPSLEANGFIHLSTPAQVLQVANNWYRGQRGLVLLVIDAARLTSRVVYEAPDHPAPATVEMPPVDERFPHLYGPLNLDAVVKVLDFIPNDDGTFDLPALGV